MLKRYCDFKPLNPSHMVVPSRKICWSILFITWKNSTCRWCWCNSALREVWTYSWGQPVPLQHEDRAHTRPDVTGLSSCQTSGLVTWRHVPFIDMLTGSELGAERNPCEPEELCLSSDVPDLPRLSLQFRMRCPSHILSTCCGRWRCRIAPPGASRLDLHQGLTHDMQIHQLHKFLPSEKTLAFNKKNKMWKSLKCKEVIGKSWHCSQFGNLPCPTVSSHQEGRQNCVHLEQLGPGTSTRQATFECPLHQHMLTCDSAWLLFCYRNIP